jgi:hypothetical protein
VTKSNTRLVGRGLLLSATAFGFFGACGGSADTAPTCNRGDTRACLGEGRCAGAQICLEDRSGFGPCACTPIGAGGVSGSGAAGSSATGGASDTGTTGGASGSATADGSIGSGGSSSGTGGIGGAGSGGISVGGLGGVGGAGFDGCAVQRIPAQQTPFDLFILLDQSGSMVLFENRWTPIVSAIKAFVASPEMDGVGVALNYFGFFPPGQPPTDPNSPGSCNANDYARPAVPIEVLPNVRQKIENSLNAATPGGSTPTHPALQGAMQYLTVHALTNPGRRPFVVLATDGEPQGCSGNDVNTVAQVAQAGAAATPRIVTYVIGVGSNLHALNQIAQAGGSTQAFLVDAGNNQQFLDAMKQVRGTIAGCEFSVPRGAGGTAIDFTRLNLLHTPAGSVESLVYHVNGLADCRADTGGWFYERDAQGNPVSVKLCPASCKSITDGGGRLDFAVGCTSAAPPP